MALTLPEYPTRTNHYQDFPEAFDGMSTEEVLLLASTYVRLHTKCFKHCSYATFLLAEAMFKGIPSARLSAKREYLDYSRLVKPTVEDLPYSVRLLAYHLRQ